MSALMSTRRRKFDPRIANSIRFIFAVVRLRTAYDYDVLKRGFGKALLDILKKQFPDQDVDADPYQVGHRMFVKVLKEMQNQPDVTVEIIQDWLKYITTGSDNVRVPVIDPDTGKPEKDKKGKPVTKLVPRDLAEHGLDPWDFAKDHKTWQRALNDALANLRLRGITESRKQFEKKQVEEEDPTTGEKRTVEKQRRYERGLEEAFGKRTEEGGREKAEERMPTSDAGMLGKALDNQLAIKQFMEIMEEHAAGMSKAFPYEQRTLFDLIFYDEIGDFQAGTDENMAQASELWKKFNEDANKGVPEAIALVKRYPCERCEAGDPYPHHDAKGKQVPHKIRGRWSGFVTETREKLLESIGDYIMDHLPKYERDVLRDEFFHDIIPEKVREKGKEKSEAKELEQLKKDVRSIGKYKFKEQAGEKATAKQTKAFKNLSKKLEGEGIDVDKIEPIDPKIKFKLSDDMVIPYKSEKIEEFIQKIKKLEDKDTLTRVEQYELKSLKAKLDRAGVDVGSAEAEELEPEEVEEVEEDVKKPPSIQRMAPEEPEIEEPPATKRMTPKELEEWEAAEAEEFKEGPPTRRWVKEEEIDVSPPTQRMRASLSSVAYRLSFGFTEWRGRNVIEMSSLLRIAGRLAVE
jgi:hypothetical protein